jgi:hypothetical protein
MAHEPPAGAGFVRKGLYWLGEIVTAALGDELSKKVFGRTVAQATNYVVEKVTNEQRRRDFFHLLREKPWTYQNLRSRLEVAVSAHRDNRLVALIGKSLIYDTQQIPEKETTRGEKGKTTTSRTFREKEVLNHEESHKVLAYWDAIRSDAEFEHCLSLLEHDVVPQAMQRLVEAGMRQPLRTFNDRYRAGLNRRLARGGFRRYS